MAVVYNKSIEDIKSFFERESMHKVMKNTLSLILSGKKVDFKLEIGGGSYTDGETVVVGLSEELFKASYEEIYTAIIALLGHEAQHVLSSNFKEFEKYNKEETNRLINKGFPRNLAENLVHAVGNCIEDGRIERILANKLPGYISKLQFLNMYFWNLHELEKDSDELQSLIVTILTLSTLGIYPKGYSKIFSGTELDKEIKKVKDLIFKGVAARTCKDGLNICREIIRILEPYLEKLYEKIKDDYEIMEKMMKLLEELKDDFRNSEETETNDSQKHSQHLSMPQKKNEDGNSGSQSGENNCSKSGNDDATKNKNKDENIDNENGIKDSIKDNNDSKDNSGDNNKSNENSSEGNHNNKDNKEEGLSMGMNTVSSGETEAFSEEEIAEKMKEITKGLFDEAKNTFKEAINLDKKNKKENPDDSLSGDEICDFKKDTGFDLTEYPNDFSLSHDLPTEIKISTKKFKKDIEKIFKNKSTMSINGQNKGVLNTNDLYRIGIEDYNIFSIEGNKSISDYVAYILQDGSGSMCGEKELNSAYALSIIEEGLKGVIPFKLVTFKAGYNKIYHYIIKNWNDNSKKNYSYNFLHHRAAGGGNEDGLSIQIATKELLKRPEKDKILIILSDGLPCDVVQTKNAIKEARAKGIYLVGIMFGNKDFRERNFEAYKNMYQKNIISTEPNGISNKLTGILKKILVR